MNVDAPLLALLSRTIRGICRPAADTTVELQDLLDGTLTVFGVSGGGVLLADEHGAPQVAATSGRQAWVEETLQLERDAGPCLEAFRRDQLVRADTAAEARRRWPIWAEHLTIRYASILAVPFAFGGQRIGSLNLFDERPDAFDDSVAATVHHVTDIVSAVLLLGHHQQQAATLAGQLQHALDSRVVIEQAKGVLAERLTMPIADTFELLRDRARHSGRKLVDVAAAVVAGSADETR